MSREEEMEISCSTKVARRGRGAITPSTLESSRDARTAVNHYETTAAAAVEMLGRKRRAAM